ncbi:MAG: M14 family metallopeptidase, partial [Planctomycetota bacterium]
MAPQAARGQMPAGYEGYAAFRASVDRLAASDRVAASVLAKTAGGRDVVLLTVGAGEPDTKPAVLVVGGVEAGDLVGSHLAMMIAEQLAAAPDAGASLLEDVTFYIIPRPSPDAAERLFEAPVVASHANTRPTDDDRDGATDEDPPEDLNGDGLITAMRVADEAGQYMPHPDEPRLLVKADPTKGERGVYRLLTEGVDNDGDERWNEDGPGGVDFNRNFTYRYPFFKPGAGPHQVSEPETRGVADFAYDHPNIFLVLSLAPQDNLNHTPKPERAAGRIRRGVQGSDAAYLKALAKRYADATGAKDAPKPAEGPGAFVPWAYHHYGRWSIAARPWWPPKPAEKKLDEKKPDEKKPEKKPAEGEQSEEVPEASGEPTAGDAAAKDREAGKAKKKQPDPRAAADR